jgi:hypothetical protein
MTSPDTAWSKDWTKAPTDGTQILVRHADWDCPAVMHYVDIDGDDTADGPYWAFTEDVIAVTEGGLVDTDECEWALMPK